MFYSNGDWLKGTWVNNELDGKGSLSINLISDVLS